MCGADEEPNEWPDRDAARAEARAIGGQMRGRIDPILRRYDDLKKRGDELLQDDETKSRAEAIMRSLEEILAKLRRIEAGGALKGADHPMSQYAAEHGKQMHDDYGRKYSCNVYDQPYDGAGGRPDCVVLVSKECWVYEFKPDTPAAIRKGGEQLDRYVPAVEDYYEDRIARGTTSHSSDKERFTDLVKAHCMSGGAVAFTGKVVPYPLCEKKFECVR